MVKVEQSGEPPGAWESLWSQDPHATLFLHPRWSTALLRVNPRFQPHYLIALESGEIAGLLPLMRLRRMGIDQFLSLPFGTHGGPLLRPEADPSVLTALCEAFRRLTAGVRTYRFEMQVFDPPRAWQTAIAPVLGDYVREDSTHVIRLTDDFEKIWATRYRRNTRNCVRQAERAGVTVVCEPNRKAVAILHRLHSQLSRAWPGARPCPMQDIETICETLGEAARIFVARRDGRPLSATLFLEHPSREVHAWLSGASPEARKVRATHLLYHEALRDACARHLHVWHFGGSAGNRDIEFFKESFGAVRVPVLRCFHVTPWAKLRYSLDPSRWGGRGARRGRRIAP